LDPTNNLLNTLQTQMQQVMQMVSQLQTQISSLNQNTNSTTTSDTTSDSISNVNNPTFNISIGGECCPPPVDNTCACFASMQDMNPETSVTINICSDCTTEGSSVSFLLPSFDVSFVSTNVSPPVCSPVTDVNGNLIGSAVYAGGTGILTTFGGLSFPASFALTLLDRENGVSTDAYQLYVFFVNVDGTLAFIPIINQSLIDELLVTDNCPSSQ